MVAPRVELLERLRLLQSTVAEYFASYRNAQNIESDAAISHSFKAKDGA